jgi:hypothetical protein
MRGACGSPHFLPKQTLSYTENVGFGPSGHGRTLALLFPDYAQARDAGCDYLLKVEIHKLRLETRRPGITIGSPRTPGVAKPESLNKRYTARLDSELTKMGNTEPLVDSVSNGESDSELQAAAKAADILANRVLGELKKSK